MEAEGHVTHEQIVDRVSFVAKLAGTALAGIVALATTTFGSCVATRDLVQSHETKIEHSQRDIAELRAADERVTESLRQIHGSVERIAGALGVREDRR